MFEDIRKNEQVTKQFEERLTNSFDQILDEETIQRVNKLDALYKELGKHEEIEEQ